MAGQWAGKIKSFPFTLSKFPGLTVERATPGDTSSECILKFNGSQIYAGTAPSELEINPLGTDFFSIVEQFPDGTNTYTPNANGFLRLVRSTFNSQYNGELALFMTGSLVWTDVFSWNGEGNGAATYQTDVRIGLYVDEDEKIATLVEVYTNNDGSIHISWSYPSEPASSMSEEWSVFGTAWTDSDDPYDDDSGEGGGHGTDDGNDPIDEPELPSLSAVDAGFITVYVPTAGQIKALASYMWSTDFYTNIVKLWADPMDVILGLSIVPVAPTTAADASTVKVGNVSTGVSMKQAASQYVTVDCGSLTINEYYGSYLDYAPYTKISIFLPYCGVHALNTDEVMGKTVAVKYHIDILTGACIAFVLVGGSVYYSFTGNVATNIPVTGENFSRLIQTGISIAGTLASTVATGGVGGITAAGVMSAGRDASSMANNIASSKPAIEKSGSLSGSGGLLANQTPYLIRERPRACVPSKQNIYLGYPDFVYHKLDDMSGYTVVDQVRLTNMTCTRSEYDEIISLLKGGVIA